MNVHGMNDSKPENQEGYRSLMLLDALSKGELLSQRDLSKRLGIALGLVNSYLKNLVAKGYITISQIPAKRYAYYLTPTGFAEKTRLTYSLLQDYTNIYRTARRDFRKLFSELSSQGVRSVAFAGVDEVTEIAYLSLQETDLELSGVFDDSKAGKIFFKNPVRPFEDVSGVSCDVLVLTTILRSTMVHETLSSLGIDAKKIWSISSAGLMKQ